MKINKKLATLIVFVVALVLLSFYIYKDLGRENKDMDNNENATTTEKIIKEGSYTDENGVTYNIEKINNNQLPPAPNLDKQIVFGEGLSQGDKDRLTKSITTIISLLKKDSTSFENWIELGSNRKAAGDYRGAVEAWEYASKIAPKSHLPYHNLGDLYHYYLKDYPKSEQNFLKAIEINQTNIISYLGLFDLYNLSFKQYTNSAENILLKGVKNNPGDVNLLITLADYYSEKGNDSNALIYYKKALEQAKKTDNTALISQLQDKINSLEK